MVPFGRAFFERLRKMDHHTAVRRTGDCIEFPFRPVCRKKVEAVHRNISSQGKNEETTTVWSFAWKPKRPMAFEDWNQCERRIDLRERSYRIRDDMTEQETRLVNEIRRLEALPETHLILRPHKAEETVFVIKTLQFTSTLGIALQIQHFGRTTRTQLRCRLSITIKSLNESFISLYSFGATPIEQYSWIQKNLTSRFCDLQTPFLQLGTCRETTAGDYAAAAIGVTK